MEEASMTNRDKIRVPCPSCEEFIYLRSRPQLDDKIRCPHCRVDLVVVDLNPVELDWDDYEDEDDDDWDWDDEDEDDDDTDWDEED
jgi:hypothetical protein